MSETTPVFYSGQMWRLVPDGDCPTSSNNCDLYSGPELDNGFYLLQSFLSESSRSLGNPFDPMFNTDVKMLPTEDDETSLARDLQRWLIERDVNCRRTSPLVCPNVDSEITPELSGVVLSDIEIEAGGTYWIRIDNTSGFDQHVMSVTVPSSSPIDVRMELFGFEAGPYVGNNKPDRTVDANGTGQGETANWNLGPTDYWVRIVETGWQGGGTFSFTDAGR